MATSPTIHAATYRRVSTYQQKDGTSPETQLDRGHKLITDNRWAHEHAWDFYDGGVSGGRASRADLDRLFEMCRHGMLDVVVVGDLSRLSRDMRDSLNFEWELEQLGVKVIDADQPDADELARMFTYLQGHWQRAQIRKVTHRGILAVAEAGYWPGGRAPFGWRIAPAPDHPKRKVVVRDDAEAATIERAVGLVLDGKSCWETAKTLNATGRLARDGGRWAAQNLARMLRKPHLAGAWTLHSDAGDYTIRGPELVPAGRFERVQAILADRPGRPRADQRVYPLSGRVTGPCGQCYTGTYRRDRDLRQYQCRANDVLPDVTMQRCQCPKVQAGWLEQAVWAEVAKLLSDPGRLLELAGRYLDVRGTELHAEGAEISELDRKLAAAKRRRTNLALAAADTGPEAVADALEQVNADIAKLEALLAQARAWAQANAERATLVRDLGRLAAAAREVLADPTPEQMREVLARLDVRVRLDDQGVRHRRHARPSLEISGVLVGDLAELGGQLGNLTSASRWGSARRQGPWR